MTQSFLYYIVPIPLLLVAVLAARIWSHRGAHPATYKMSDSWVQTHPPILWAATDEAISSQADFSVGGGASGKW